MPFFLCNPHGHEAHHIDLLEHKALFDALMEDKSINVEFKICLGKVFDEDLGKVLDQSDEDPPSSAEPASEPAPEPAKRSARRLDLLYPTNTKRRKRSSMLLDSDSEDE